MDVNNSAEAAAVATRQLNGHGNRSNQAESGPVLSDRDASPRSCSASHSDEGHSGHPPRKRREAPIETTREALASDRPKRMRMGEFLNECEGSVPVSLIPTATPVVSVGNVTASAAHGEKAGHKEVIHDSKAAIKEEKAQEASDVDAQQPEGELPLAMEKTPSKMDKGNTNAANASPDRPSVQLGTGTLSHGSIPAKISVEKDEKAARDDDSVQSNGVNVAFEFVGETRSGRKTKRRYSTGATTPTKKASTMRNGSPAAKVDEKTDLAPVAEGPAIDLCGICGEMEDDALTDFLLCDGDCLGSYHLGCLGMDEPPEEEKWLCEQCRTNEQKCFACDRFGTIGEKGGVFKCNMKGCGKFFHQSCVNSHALTKRMGKVKAASMENEHDDDDTRDDFDTAFRCPRHTCSVCEGKKRGRDLMYCLRCPESYHPTCVPPSARYNTIGLLCSRHPHEQLPRIPSFFYTDNRFETVIVDYNVRLPVLYVPKKEPDVQRKQDMHHFRLLLNLVEDVQLQPPPFRRITRNVYTFKAPKPDLEDCPSCVCKEKCGDDCINRLSFTECFGPAPMSGVKLNRQNRESNCPIGEHCGNRAMHQRCYPRFERFHTPDKGWALRVLEPVKAGQLVIEYVGEVINEAEKEQRLIDHTNNHPDDKNMYIMELGKNEYIDARFKGSVSRFINHSCDPNCHLLKWKVRGMNRIAITAKRDIGAGEELSYDYQFNTRQAMEWKCHCKAKKCRGTMAPEKIRHGDEVKSPEKKLTKKEQMKKMKRALQQERLQQVKEDKATTRRLSLTTQVTMGDSKVVNKSAVRIGPVSREMQFARQYQVFLPRNALRGYDFLRRKQLWDVRVERCRKRHRSAQPNGQKRSRIGGRSASSSPVRKETASSQDIPSETDNVKMESEPAPDIETNEKSKTENCENNSGSDVVHQPTTSEESSLRLQETETTAVQE